MKHFLIIDPEKNVLVAPVNEDYLAELIKAQDLENVIRCQNKAAVKKVVDAYFKSNALLNKREILLALEEEKVIKTYAKRDQEVINECRKK